MEGLTTSGAMEFIFLLHNHKKLYTLRYVFVSDPSDLSVKMYVIFLALLFS